MKNSICFLLLFTFIYSCSKDENVTEVKNTSLKVIVVDGSDNLISKAKITTIPATKTVYTNIHGEAIINDIVSGEYTVKVQLLGDDNREYITETTTKLKEGIQNRITVVLIDLVDPISPITPSIESIITEVYDQLNNEYIFDAGGYIHYWGDIGSDGAYVDYRTNNVYGFLDRYTFDENDNFIKIVWERHYNVIAGSINYGLKELKNIGKELSPTEKAQKAELMFLRGLLYFNLVKLYGNPFVATEENYQDFTSTYSQGGKETYGLIISDLLFAKENLPTYNSSVKASKEAATALLGKVYLQSAGFPMLLKENYKKALQQFQEVEGKFTLSQDYGTLFASEAQENPEIIFKIDFDLSKNKAGNYGVFWGPLGYSIYNSLLLSPNVIDAYFDDPSTLGSPISFPIDAPDKRFYQNIATFKVEEGQKINLENTNDWRPYKYQKNINIPVQENGENFDFIVLRYADVLLMKAEAINAISGPTSEAYELVNKVRRRAYLDEKHNLPVGLSKLEFTKAILNERKKEFFMEGHRKDDLIRNQMLESVINIYNEQPEIDQKRRYEPHKYIWPIPRIELDLSPGTKQNVGY